LKTHTPYLLVKTIYAAGRKFITQVGQNLHEDRKIVIIYNEKIWGGSE